VLDRGAGGVQPRMASSQGDETTVQVELTTLKSPSPM
jgi:hypothetical protein